MPFGRAAYDARVAASAPTVTGACPRCDRDAAMVRGRCPNCGFVRDPSVPGPPARFVRGPRLSDDLDDVFWIALWLAPVLVLAVLGFVLALDWLLIAAAVALVVPAVIRAALDGL